MPAANPSRAAGALSVLVALAFVVPVTWCMAQLASAQRPPGRPGGHGPGGASRADADVATDAAANAGPDASDGGAPSAGNDPDVDASEARRIRANGLFREGLEAFRRNDYVTAATRWEAAYQTLPAAVVLFNIGRAWEGANEVPRAISAYERYVAEAPQAPDRQDALNHLASLRARPTPVFLSSEPPGATVFLDEESQPAPTPTPIVVRLAPGPHVVVMERQGYRRTVRRIVARAGEATTISVRLQAEGGEAVAGVPSPGQLRILNRRTESLLSTRFAFLFGGARAWNGDDLHLTFGAEAYLFVGRSLATKLHFERIEPDGVWTILTGDLGYVFTLEDLDLGVFATAGAGYGAIDRTHPTQLQFSPIAGFEGRVDWLFHPRLSLGLFFRATWRNFFVAPIEPLNSLGLSISLSP